MSSCIALVRGINVGGKALLSMAALREMFADLGFPDARTLLQSGNVVFSADAWDRTALESTLEKEAAKRFSVSPDFFVRSASEWAELASANPLKDEAREDPGRLSAMVLKAPPEPATLERVRAGISGPEVVRAGTCHLYVYYPAGMGSSKLTNVAIERALGTRGTMRNWNTVLRLLAAAEN